MTGRPSGRVNTDSSGPGFHRQTSVCLLKHFCTYPVVISASPAASRTNELCMTSCCRWNLCSLQDLIPAPSCTFRDAVTVSPPRRVSNGAGFIWTVGDLSITAKTAPCSLPNSLGYPHSTTFRSLPQQLFSPCPPLFTPAKFIRPQTRVKSRHGRVEQRLNLFSTLRRD